MDMKRREFLKRCAKIAIYLSSGTNLGCLETGEKKTKLIEEDINPSTFPEIKIPDKPEKEDKSIQQKGDITVYVSGENPRIIPYDKRDKFINIANELWGLNYNEPFDSYAFLNGKLRMIVDKKLSVSKVEGREKEYGILYKLVLKDEENDRKQKPYKTNEIFEEAIQEMYLEESQTALMPTRYTDGNNPITPKCIILKKDDEKIAIKHAIIDGKNYIAIGFNTQGNNSRDDNSDSNANELVKGLYTSGGSSGGDKTKITGNHESRR